MALSFRHWVLAVVAVLAGAMMLTDPGVARANVLCDLKVEVGKEIVVEGGKNWPGRTCHFAIPGAGRIGITYSWAKYFSAPSGGIQMKWANRAWALAFPGRHVSRTDEPKVPVEGMPYKTVWVRHADAAAAGLRVDANLSALGIPLGLGNPKYRIPMQVLSMKVEWLGSGSTAKEPDIEPKPPSSGAVKGPAIEPKPPGSDTARRPDVEPSGVRLVPGKNWSWGSRYDIIGAQNQNPFTGGRWSSARGGSDFIQLDFGGVRRVTEVRIQEAGTDITTDGCRIAIKLRRPDGSWMVLDEFRDTNINRTALSGGRVAKRSTGPYRRTLSPPVEADAFRLEIYGNGWFDATDIQIFAAAPAAGSSSSSSPATGIGETSAVVTPTTFMGRLSSGQVLEGVAMQGNKTWPFKIR